MGETPTISGQKPLRLAAALAPHVPSPVTLAPTVVAAATPSPAPSGLTTAPANLGLTLCLSVLEKCDDAHAGVGGGLPGLWSPGKALMNTPGATYLPPIVPYRTDWQETGVASIARVDFADAQGKHLSADAIAAEIIKQTAGLSKVDQVDKVLASFQHGAAPDYALQYKVDNNLFSVRKNTAQGLAQSGGECDFFANAIAYVLIAAKVLTADEIRIVSERGQGGGHTVDAFSLDGGKTWGILNNAMPAKRAMLGAPSAAMAVRQYFQNGEIQTVSKSNPDPSKNPLWQYNVNSFHRAMTAGMLDMWGIEGLSGIWGSPQTLNEPGGPKLPNLSYAGATVGVDHTRVQNGGFTGEIRYDMGTGFARKGFTSAGLSQLFLDGKRLWGYKADVSQEATGGTNTGAYYESWWVGEHHYVGVVAGAEFRNQIHSEEVAGSLTTLAPMARLSAGTDGNLIGNRDTRLQLTYFNGVRLGGGVPFVLGSKEAKAQLDANSNGLDPNGLYDPGFLGLLDLGGASGLGFRYDIFEADKANPRKLTLQGALVGRWEANDPSVSLVPHTAAEAKLNLRYDSARLSANLGGAVTPGGIEIDHDGAKWKAGGIYDRDPKWQAHANLGLRVGDNTRMSAQLSFIRYTSDDTAVVGALAARTACPLFDKLDCTLSTGFIGQGTATLPDVVRPFANFSVGTRFDTK